MKAVEIRGVKIGEGIPKICVPITGNKREQIIEETEAIKNMGPDLAEWRADCYEDAKNPEKSLELLKTIHDILGPVPLLFTFRTDKEGGNLHIGYEDYVNLLMKAAKTGFADLIDVEIFFCKEQTPELVKTLKEYGVRVIASNHHFDGTPSIEEMDTFLCEMDAAGADILKLAVMPHTEEDLGALLYVTAARKRKTEKPVITMSMGKIGVLSRLCGEAVGSCVTFAAGISASAPGQIPVKEMRKTLAVLHRNFT